MEVRSLYGLKNVLYDQKWLKKSKDFDVYHMWRRIYKGNGLRYNETLLFPKMLGKEYPKTKGHKHKPPLPEFYFVISGRAVFLFQKSRGKKVEEVYAIKAKKGEAVIVPKGFSHITINPSSKIPLLTGDIAKGKYVNDYKEIEKNHGACYYYTKQGWIKNSNYTSIPKLVFKKPFEPRW